MIRTSSEPTLQTSICSCRTNTVCLAEIRTTSLCDFCSTLQIYNILFLVVVAAGFFPFGRYSQTKSQFHFSCFSTSDDSSRPTNRNRYICVVIVFFLLFFSLLVKCIKCECQRNGEKNCYNFSLRLLPVVCLFSLLCSTADTVVVYLIMTNENRTRSIVANSNGKRIFGFFLLFSLKNACLFVRGG